MVDSMGQASSVARSSANGIVVTFDALGTLYRFKKPVATQYLEVARRCGLKASIQEADLHQAFKRSYKSFVSQYPNYGRDKLESPSQWWHNLVHTTFREVVSSDEIPPALGQTLYDHFSSAEAYELFDDVQPFLQSMRDLRMHHDKPLLFGIVSNSDPRVRNILESFDLDVGDAQFSTMMAKARSGEVLTKSVWEGTYNASRDFDFLCTSYDAGAEKPDSRIWQHAFPQASFVIIDRTEKEQGKDFRASGFSGVVALTRHVVENTKKIRAMEWIHVGDELEKDYHGARNAGLEAILLYRDGKHESLVEGRLSNLEEVAAVIKVMVNENFGG